ncbi:MAG: heavy metal translocating P-type ATPase [Phycisphaera sp.]|nr:MAG: heavy metal translocating P-type ATPase [Phycisphaera sp.]
MSRAANPSMLDAHTSERCPCTHCGLSVPRGLIEPSREEQFCCAACETAHEAIKACGLGAYYELRERLEADARPARSTGNRYEQFDAEAFQRVHVVSDEEAGRSSCEVYLEGVHCAACVWLVERVPQILPGVIEARLDLGRSLVSLTWNKDDVKLSRIAQVIDSLGYRVHPPSRSSDRSARRAEDRRALIRIGIAGALAGNSMLLAIALYAGMFEGIDSGTRLAFRLISAAMAVASVLWPGRVFFIGALAAIRTRTWHLDMPIALALGIGLIAGVANAVRDAGEVYFDSITMLVFLLLVGRWFQQRGQRAAADALELLFALTPATAHVVGESGEVTQEPIEAVTPGMTVEVHAGDSAPVDGVILSGKSSVDESVMTGESRPVGVSQGDRVAAGSVNIAAPIRVLAEAVGDQTRLGKVMRDIERHARLQTPVIGQADRIAGAFVVVVMALALATFAYWVPKGAEGAIEHATALLIVCCPCALALATPLVTAVSVGRAAKSGVLVKGAGAFEDITRPGTVLLDKTGTLTKGTFTCVKWIGDESSKRQAAALERGATHPIARVIASLDEDDSLAVTDVEHRTGQGVVGFVDGNRVCVGSLALMETEQVAPGRELLQSASGEAALGNTPIFVAVGDRVRAVAVLGDEIRSESRTVVERLGSMGWRVGMLSGDRQEVVSAVAAQVGIEPDLAIGGVSPEGKVERVKAFKERGPVVMVGDGVNDASALVNASFGIALQGGAEASLAAAHSYIIDDQLEQVPAILGGARRTVSAVRRCLGVSLGYNAVAACLAAGGLLTPLVAAFLMPVSSLTVLGLALHSRTFASKQ